MFVGGAVLTSDFHSFDVCWFCNETKLNKIIFVLVFSVAFDIQEKRIKL